MKYRIVQIEEKLFQVQIKKRYWLFWEILNHHGRYEGAQRCVRTCKKKDKDFPVILWSD